MDKIKKYQNIIIEFLENYAKRVKPANAPDIDAHVIADTKNNHFQFLRVGWQGKRYCFAAIFHFDIKNEKIWIQRNNTEYEVVDFLMEREVYRICGCLKSYSASRTLSSIDYPQNKV